MKRLLLSASFLIGCSSAVFCQEQAKSITKRFPSPDRLYTAIYKGDEYGEGEIYISAGSAINQLFESDGSSIPEFKWLTSSILMINIRCGNPCWHVRYYNTTTSALSPDYEFPLAMNTTSGLVVHVGADDEIVVSEMCSGKIRLRYKPFPKRCEEFLFFYRVKFMNPFTISVRCSNNKTTLHIPKEPLP